MRSILFAVVVAVAAPQVVSSHPPVTIMELQGRGHVSPLLGDTVATTGVTTVVTRVGFYVQDPIGDGDPATSDAVFAYTVSEPALAPGDLVRLDGVVHEYRPGNVPSNLTVTELDQPRVEVLSRNHPLPDPVRLGRGGRLPPTSVIDDDSLARFDPGTDGIDFFESLESMRVLVPEAVAVNVTNRFGEVWVLADAGAWATGVNARRGITVSPDDFNPERIQLDDTLLPFRSPTVEVGDIIGDVLGVVSYRYGNFEVLPSSLPPSQRMSRPREKTEFVAGPNDLTIASFNVENLGRGDKERIAALAKVVVAHLRSPDVVVFEEIQDDSGASNDGTVGATLTFEAVIAAVADAGGPEYDFREIPPEDGRDGGAPGANVRVGILFRPARVTFVDRGVPSATVAATVLETDRGPALSPNPGRVEPSAGAWHHARKPLAAELALDGHRFFIVACHFSSRSGSGPLFGAVQPPVVERAEKRLAQAQIVRRFVGRVLDADPGARVIVLGDFNDFQFSKALESLAGPLANLTDRLPEPERYTFNYQGNSQALDHILVSDALAERARYDIVRACVDFAESVSDHDPVLALLPFSAPEGPAARSPALVVAPNPFVREARVSCSVAGVGPLEAVIYDVNGRRVRTLRLLPTGEGLHEGAWPGLDDRRRPVAPGVYFVRVAIPQGNLTAKVVRVN